MRILCAALCCVMGAWAAESAHAQSALAATELDPSALSTARVTLRPDPDMAELARQVAAVLELRTGQRVTVGAAPPPDLLEAVPAGHVALAARGDSVLLVLGAPGGRSFEASVNLEGPAASDTDARAVALALEALRDEAADLSRSAPPAVDAVPAPDPPAPDSDREEAALAAAPAPATTVDPPEEDPAVAAAVDRPPPTSVVYPQTQRAGAERAPRSRPSGRLSDVEANPYRPSKGPFLTEVEPLFFLRLYGGASSASTTLMTGLGAGVGVCVRGHCLYLAGELPAQLGASSPRDVRYRYTTFSSGFYTRPISFGDFTPGGSLGFFTRVGHFGRDMGLGDSGLDTDLGARATVELAYEPVTGLDLMAEGGIDYTIDRHLLTVGNLQAERGDRWIPWIQASVRYRP